MRFVLLLLLLRSLPAPSVLALPPLAAEVLFLAAVLLPGISALAGLEGFIGDGLVGGVVAATGASLSVGLSSVASESSSMMM